MDWVIILNVIVIDFSEWWPTTARFLYPLPVNQLPSAVFLGNNDIGAFEKRAHAFCKVWTLLEFSVFVSITNETRHPQLPTFDAKFPARVLGLPAPDITWYKNGSPIKESEKYHIKRDGDACCLYVRDLELDDAGTFKCVAKNREGEASCEAKLEVVDKM